MSETPDFILYAQHGWADSSREITALAQSIASSNTKVVTPNLGFVKTWLRIEPLIEHVEQVAIDMLATYPETPIRIIGHSMGGLIWLEVLNRHPEWWSQVDSLVLVASPVGGSDLGRIVDPLQFGLGIARDLGKNRRTIAETIAAVIPTLTIAGDYDGGSDGTIPVESSKFRHAKFVCIYGLPHATLKNHPAVAAAIRDFWGESTEESELSGHLIQRLRLVAGMTDAHRRDFERSQTLFTFEDGTTMRTWKNPFGVDHVFVASPRGQCLYGGFVGWLHADDLRQALEEIQREYQPQL
ncbi:alpha/beta hydrolase [Trichocoleus sp. FACHB-591]|uniref:alpha/beta hydrolase n=1 Tax=Trichocoleus sp. FACHB-591 TaxID=2692872 RepID=UPI0016879F42|nr:alpha/beta hydrolase [Trichocoleus sp. FACHB-591]